MNNTHHRYTFKDPAAWSRFNRAVHQAMLDTCELDESEDFVHLAGDEEGDVGAPVILPDDAPDTSLIIHNGVPDDDFGVTALLVAAGLRNLIKD